MNCKMGRQYAKIVKSRKTLKLATKADYRLAQANSAVKGKNKMFTKSSLTEHPIRAKIVTRAQTEQFALLSEQHCSFEVSFYFQGLAVL